MEGEGAELINQVTTWWVFPGQSITLKSNGTIWRKLAGHEPVMHVEDQKAANTAGGTFTQAAWRVRVLNTEVLNEIAGASLAGNQITLPPGVYYFECSAPAFIVHRHKAKIASTAPADILIGTSEIAGSGDSTQTRSHVSGPVSIAAQTIFELRHYCETTRATDGLGQADNFAVIEVFAVVKIRKVA